MTLDEIEAIAHRTAWRYRKSRDPHHSDSYTFNRATLEGFAARLLAEAHPPTIRLPEPMTDEEIDVVPWEPSYENPMTLREGLHLFARAIEDETMRRVRKENE